MPDNHEAYRRFPVGTFVRFLPTDVSVSARKNKTFVVIPEEEARGLRPQEDVIYLRDVNSKEEASTNLLDHLITISELHCAECGSGLGLVQDYLCFECRYSLEYENAS